MKVIHRIAGPKESMMKILTIEPINGNPPNSILEVSEREGEQLIRKGLAKAAPVAKNKMAAEGANKGDPSEGDGSARTSSSSPAAPRSVRKTATRSAAGALKRSPGRPKRAPTAE